MARRPCVGLAMGIVSGGRLDAFVGGGVADIRSGAPFTEDTVIRVASITKTLTAVAVMQLWEQGLVDLDAPAADYLRQRGPVALQGRSVGLDTVQLGFQRVPSHLAAHGQSLSAPPLAIETLHRGRDRLDLVLSFGDCAGTLVVVVELVEKVAGMAQEALDIQTSGSMASPAMPRPGVASLERAPSAALLDELWGEPVAH